MNSLIVGNPYGLFIEILPPAFPGAPLTIDGDVEIVGDLTVEDIFADDITANTLTVALGTFDNLQVNINANVNGHTTLNTLATSGNTTVAGTLGVTGAATLSNALTVAGTTNLNGLTNVNNNLVVTGTSDLRNSISNTSANNGGAVYVNDLFSVGAFATNLGGTLTVAGATTLNGATQVNNTLGVTGHTSLTTLGTSGLAKIGRAHV